MPKLTEEQAFLLERILEEGLLAVTGEEVPVTINLPKREPEYEYVTDGKRRPLRPGDWYYTTSSHTFEEWSCGPTSSDYLPYRRIEKKP